MKKSVGLLAGICCVLLIVTAIFVKVSENNESTKIEETTEVTYVSPMEEVISVSENAIDTFDDEKIERLSKFTSTTAELLLKGKENICYSPISMYSSLAVMAETSSGGTTDKLFDVLGVENMSEIEDSFETYFKVIKDASTGTKSIKLSNSLWLDNDYELSQSAENVLNRCNEYFGTYIHYNKFNLSDVNKWVNEETNGLIKKLSDSNSSEFMILNVLYYKSPWYKQFQVSGVGEFELENGKTVHTQYMECAVGTSKYVKGENYVAVAASLYVDNMYFILPDEGTELNELVNAEIINEIIASTMQTGEINSANVTLRVPLFKYESYINGAEAGMNSLFDDTDWSGISEELNGIPFSMCQRTYISVDEEGIEAAAVTEAYSSIGLMPEQEIKLAFDRPFMYLVIREGIPLFIGTVYNPTEG